MSITINLKQARELVDFFGDEDQDVVLTHADDGHSGPGLYVYCADHSDEGAVFLGDS